MDAALLVVTSVVFGAVLGASIFYVSIRARLAQIDKHVAKLELQALEDRNRSLEAGSRSLESRIAVIRIGEKLDDERRKYSRMAKNLVGVVKCLLDCIDNPENVKDINRPAITRMIQSILDESAETYMVM